MANSPLSFLLDVDELGVTQFNAEVNINRQS